MRASRASAPSSAPAAPTTPAASATPTSSSGRRAHGSPPVTPPTSATMPNTIAIAAPSASADDGSERDLRPDELPERARGRAAGARSSLRRARPPPRPRRGASARNVTVSAIPYDCTCADSSQLRPFAFGWRSWIGCAVACSAVPVRASPARAVWMKVRIVLHALRLRHRREQLLGAVEPEHRERLPEEAAAAAVQDQPHEDEVRLDEDALQLAVELVDERLHLLGDARRDGAAARLRARGSGSRRSSRARRRIRAGR